MQITLTNGLVRAYLGTLGYHPEPGLLHLIGIRSAVPAKPFPGAEIELVPAVNDRYNDTIGYFGTALGLFRGSVDPGKTWTLKPSNPRGCAHLLEGEWFYRKGKHGGHDALVQAGPVQVWRDRDGDFLRDHHDQVEKGFFGLNIHAGGTSPEIGAWSAGCQVIQGGWDGSPWLQFSATYEFSRQSLFRYYLIDSRKLAALAQKSR